MNQITTITKAAALFAAIETAKENADFILSNILFARLLRGVMCGEEWAAGLRVENETEDEDGEYAPGAYYDLVTVLGDEGYACIPLPLLTAECIATLYKGGKIKDVEPREHNRAFQGRSEGYSETNLFITAWLALGGTGGELWYDSVALLADEEIYGIFSGLLPKQAEVQFTPQELSAAAEAVGTLKATSYCGRTVSTEDYDED